MVIPSTWPALHDPEAYPDPDNFIPERWLEGGSADQNMKNFLVFGVGPHYCLGQAVRLFWLALLFANALVCTNAFNGSHRQSSNVVGLGARGHFFE